jgi:hypothetical protein
MKAKPINEIESSLKVSLPLTKLFPLLEGLAHRKISKKPQIRNLVLYLLVGLRNGASRNNLSERSLNFLLDYSCFLLRIVEELKWLLSQRKNVNASMTADWLVTLLGVCLGRHELRDGCLDSPVNESSSLSNVSRSGLIRLGMLLYNLSVHHYVRLMLQYLGWWTSKLSTYELTMTHSNSPTALHLIQDPRALWADHCLSR